MLEALDLSTVELALCALAAIAGAVIQGSVGFGYALVVVPTLLIVAPAAVPVTPLVVALPMVVAQAVAERRALDPAGFARLTAGRLPGTVLGAWVLTAVGQSVVAATAGALLLCAVAASALRGARSTSPRLEVAAGFASGVAGTVGAVGGPYMGLAYADRPGPGHARHDLAGVRGRPGDLARGDRDRRADLAGRAAAGGRRSCRSRSSACGRGCGSRARSTAARCGPRCSRSPPPPGPSRSCAPCSDAGSVDGVLAVLRLPGVRSLFAFSCIGRLPMGALGLLMILVTHDRTDSFASGGLVAASYTIALGFSNPALARWVDRAGQTIVLRTGAVVSAAAMATFALLPGERRRRRR